MQLQETLRTQQLMHMAQQATVSDNQEDIILLCSEIIKDNPQDIIAYFNRGTSYSRMGHFEKAVEDYTEALKLNPTDADLYYNRGGAYIALERFEEALVDLKTCVRLEMQPVIFQDDFDKLTKILHSAWNNPAGQEILELFKVFRITRRHQGD